MRKNINILFDDEESLLIIGQQVKNTEKGRSDLTAIDSNGNIVLIEIKRDMEDIISRKEPFEFQAIRYAAGYAKIKTIDELVDKIFTSYIDRYRKEFGLGELTPAEKGRRIIEDFLKNNNAIRTINEKQRIILIASSFDRQMLSAVSWLINNGVDISCFSLQPVKIGEQLFLDIQRILPPARLEDNYIDIEASSKTTTNIENVDLPTKTYLPRMNKLFEWGIIKKGDEVIIRNFEGSDAIVINEQKVKYKDRTMKFNAWGEKVTGWSSINIYSWAMIKGQSKTLDELRKEKLQELDNIN